MTMSTTGAPIALTIGEPAGVGPDLVPLAWEALRGELDFVLLGDPDHLPKGTAFERVDSAADAARVMPDAVPVLPSPAPMYEKATVPGMMPRKVPSA